MRMVKGAPHSQFAIRYSLFALRTLILPLFKNLRVLDGRVEPFFESTFGLQDEIDDLF